MPAFDAPSFCTRGEDTREIRLRQPGQPEARHRDQGAPLPGRALNPSR
jgi:hypothetical protein